MTKTFRPKLRGEIHFIGFFLLLGSSIIMLSETTSPLDFFGKSIYVVSILSLLLISSTYHRYHWSEGVRKVIRKIDHSAIYVLIAGTATPIGIYSLQGRELAIFLFLIWTVALIGIVKTIKSRQVNKAFNAAFYIFFGLVPLIFGIQIYRALGITNITLMLSGGILYLLGAVVYVRQNPNPLPLYFGHHEIFHSFVLLASIIHFSVIYQVHL